MFPLKLILSSVFFLLVWHSTHSNLLCERDRWNEIQGTWIYNSTTCALHNIVSAGNRVNVIWFGDVNGTIPDATFDSFGSFSLKFDIFIQNGGGGALFRVRSVRTVVGENRQYYWLALRPGQSKINIARIDGATLTIVKEYPIDLEYNRSYNVMVESMINNITNYNVYLNRSLLFSVELANFTDFTDGSIGFRTYDAPIYFSNVNYTGIPITEPPTVYPTIISSLVLNYSIIVDWNAVCLFFIHIFRIVLLLFFFLRNVTSISSI